MKLTFNHDAPASAFAVPGFADATPCAAASVAPAAASLAAHAIPATQESPVIKGANQPAFKGTSLSIATGINPVLETTVRPHAMRYGGLRGVPPRGKPV